MKEGEKEEKGVKCKCMERFKEEEVDKNIKD
jgi:hypothetical protein